MDEWKASQLAIEMPAFQDPILPPHELPCNSPFFAENDQIAQQLIISAVSKAISADHQPSSSTKVEHRGAEKMRIHLRSFYQKLEKSQKIYAGLFLTSTLAKLHAKLREIIQNEQKRLEEIDLEISQQKNASNSNNTKAMTATLIAACTLMLFVPPIQAAGVAAIGYAGYRYFMHRRVMRKIAFLERKKEEEAEAANEKMRQEVKNALGEIKSYSSEIRSTMLSSTPQKRRRFLKEIGKMYSQEIMDLIRKQSAEGTEQGAVIFFSQKGSEFIPLRNVAAEFLDEMRMLLLEQIEKENFVGAMHTIREMWREISISLGITNMENIENLLNETEERLKRATAKERKKIMEEMVEKMRVPLEESRRRVFSRSIVELVNKIRGTSVQKDYRLTNLAFMMAEAECLQPLAEKINQSSILIHTHPLAPRSLREARVHMNMDIEYARLKNHIGFMAAPIKGGFALYFFDSQTIEHILDYTESRRA